MAWEAFNFPRRFGPYVLVFPLGVGGMGNVFLAIGGRLGRDKACVLKRLIPESAQDADRVARLRREAELAGRLSHASIVRTLGIEEIEGEPVIVQEFLQGRTLTQALASAQSASMVMPVELAVHVVREVAGALAYAHRAEGGGIVHRDISPENVMITFDGAVRLIDFGIARMPDDPKLTQAGYVVGRESYIAPEVFHGAAADARADVYSLGVVLWELLSGSQFLSLERAQHIAPSIVARRPGLSPQLDAVALEALAPAEARFQSAEEYRQALNPFLPAGFVGKTAVSNFLVQCYDVEAERRRLAEAIDNAKELLGPQISRGSTPNRGARRLTVGVLIAAGVLLAIATAGVSWIQHRSRPGSSLAVAPASLRRISPPSIVLSSAPPKVSPPEAPSPVRVPSETATEASGVDAAPARLRTARSRASGRARAEAIVPTAAESLADAALSLQAGEPAAAEVQARRSLGVASAAQQAQAHVIIGKSYILRHRLQEADNEFELALRVDPASKSAATELAQLRARLASLGAGTR
jgi:serine/threonine protein kinase